MWKFALCLIALIGVVRCQPTMYKLKDNKLEADLVPVSSTVIPLPVYKVGYGLNVEHRHLHHHKDEEIARPDGPIPLITAENRKKFVPTPKPKRVDQKSTVR